jgi:2-keto-3-deoxy-6-phosphogluconate aldolase
VIQGGVRCIEVTMTTPGALECIKSASEKLSGEDVCIGVGSNMVSRKLVQARDFKGIAESAWRYADAMVKARGK